MKEFLATILLTVAGWFGYSAPETPNFGATVLSVYQGGTGAQTFALGQCLVGNGSGAITTQACGAGGGGSNPPQFWTYSYTADTLTPVTSTSQLIVPAASRLGTVNATTTNVGTFLVYSGSTLNGLTTATDLRPSTLNATTTNADTLVVYTSATLPSNSITPNNVLSTGQADELCLTYELTGPTWEWQTCGTGGGGGTSVWTNDLAGLIYHPTTTDDVVIGASATTSATKLEVVGDTKLGGNASTTGYFAIGTGAPLTGMGAGDLFVGDDATITGNFEVSGNATTTGVAYLGGLRTGIINDFFDAACSVTNQFVTNVADNGTFTCSALDTSGTWSGNAGTASDLAGCTDCIGTPEITDSYLLNTGDSGTGLYTFSDLRPSMLNATTAGIDTLTLFKGISGNATTSGWVNVGTTDVVSTLGTLIGVGDLFVGDDATVTGSLAAPQFCLNGDCKTAWPTAGGGVNDWRVTSTDSTGLGLFRTSVTPTTTTSIHSPQDLTIEGNASTTGRLVVSGTPTNNFGDLWVGGDIYASGNATTTRLSVTSLNLNGVDIPDIAEYVADTSGAMFTGNTETGITVTYQDADNTVDLVVANLEDLAGTLDVGSGGSGAGTFTDGGILLGSGTGAFTVLGVAANGQIPIGDGTTDPVLNEIDEGTYIDVANGVGTISIAFDPTEITGGTTWDDAGEASVVWTWNLSGTDPTLTFGSGSVGVGGTASSTNGISVNGLFKVDSTGNATTSNLVAGVNGALGSKAACFKAMSVEAVFTYFYFNGTTQVIQTTSCEDTGSNSTTTVQFGQ